MLTLLDLTILPLKPSENIAIFPFDAPEGRSSLAGEAFETSKRSIIRSNILFNLIYFVTVCGIAALPRITFFADLQ